MKDGLHQCPGVLGTHGRLRSHPSLGQRHALAPFKQTYIYCVPTLSSVLLRRHSALTTTTRGRIRNLPAAPTDLQDWSPPQAMGVPQLGRKTHGVLACTRVQILAPCLKGGRQGPRQNPGASTWVPRFQLPDSSRSFAAIAIMCFRLPPSKNYHTLIAPIANQKARSEQMAQRVL